MVLCSPFAGCFGVPNGKEPIEPSERPQETEETVKVATPPPEVFSEVYELGEKLGEGGYGVVKKATSVRNKERRPVAVKIVTRENLKEKDERALRSEYKILKDLNHANVVQAFEWFEEPESFYVVLEFIEGGELFDRIVKKVRYNEEEARDIVVTLLTAIKYCHDHDVVHRDLKPENLLLTSAEDDCSVKLADFGLAVELNHADTVQVPKCGTPDYIAPEVILNKPIGKPVDMWSFGVIMFILLGGYPPFHDKDQKLLFQKICAGSYYYHPKRWETISDEAKDMIRKLLEIDSSKRLTAEEAMQHAWVTQEGAVLARNSLDDNLPELKKFNAARKLRVGIKAVMGVNKFLKLGSVEAMIGKDGQAIESPQVSPTGAAAAAAAAASTTATEEEAIGEADKPVEESDIQLEI